MGNAIVSVGLRMNAAMRPGFRPVALLTAAIGMVTAPSAWGDDSAPAVLTPTGRWNIEYHPEMCVLSRPYEVAGNRTMLGIQTATTDTFMTLLVMRPAYGSRRNQRSKVTITADGVTIVDGEDGMSRVAPASGARVDTAAVRRDVIPALQGAKSIAVTFRGRPPVSFAMSGTDKALVALTACERDLKASWGFDMAALDRTVVPAKLRTKAAAFFGADNYPHDARVAGRTGRAVAVISVGADGRVQGCRIAISAKTPSLDKATCDIPTASFRYDPARDAAGTAIAGQQYLAVNWLLEE